MELLNSVQKRNLLIYLFISVVSFFYLVTVPDAGIGVVVFMVIQGAWLYCIIPQKKYLFLLAPVFILALNSFISANTMWRIPNLFVGAMLYGLMAVWVVYGVSLKDTSIAVFIRLGKGVCGAFMRASTPYMWGAESRSESLPIIRRVFIGIAISIPVLIFLVVMLSRADMIFFRVVQRFFDEFLSVFSTNTIARVCLGVVIGLYLFGTVYGMLAGKAENSGIPATRQFVGDSMIINIVLSSVLLVYTMFVVIQFRYLFAAPDNLPYGLNFVTYARRGFFELLVLTFVNIVFILVSVWLTKDQTGAGAKLTKGLGMYLCAVTVVLLASSFYRMWLYGSDDGLTRMRLLVFGFLFFELIGLIITFFYIAKPKFNIVLVYFFVALSYYLLLNLVPIDRVIAREQINRYFATGHGGIHYAISLSPDAAPEIARLLQSDNAWTRSYVQAYFVTLEAERGRGWRQWNLSLSKISLH
ncbi:MAG: DUF4173 domain-containing protein [Firmicutes bacterium]|nr:DUF4173 domain-containing protein [Bacillota bacterium]